MLYKLLQKIEENKILSKYFYDYYINNKIRQWHYKEKQEINIPQEHRYKNPQKNGKLNIIEYIERILITLWVCVYRRTAR